MAFNLNYCISSITTAEHLGPVRNVAISIAPEDEGLINSKRARAMLHLGDQQVVSRRGRDDRLERDAIVDLLVMELGSKMFLSPY